MQSTHSLVRVWRIARIVVHTLSGLILAALVLPVCNRWMRLGLIQWWCKELLDCFNIHVITTGALPDVRTHGTMLVGNHVSWADIHALNSIIPVRFVAKVEIKSWPVFGYLVRKSGTIFINRTHNRDAARVVNLASHALKLNDNLCVFPEGTTTEGLTVLPFKSSLIQAAVQAEASIIPLIIRYPLPDGSINIAAAYAGETALLDSMNTYLHMQQPVVHIHFCEAVSSKGLSRQHLASHLHAQISAQLKAFESAPVTQQSTARSRD